MNQRTDATRKRRRPPRRPPWDSSEILPLGYPEPSVSLLLWQRARDVRLWAGTAPVRRQNLFHAPREGTPPTVPQPIAQPLRVLENLVRRPAEVERAEVAEACRAVLRWAESENWISVGLHFADAWAWVDHRNAEAAATAGQYCTRAASHGRAEEWLTRAVVLGRKAKDWEWHIRSFVRLGILRYELGDYRGAKRYALRAVKKADWSGHDKLGGMAYHDLLAVAIHTGSFHEGESYTSRALELYPIKFDRARHLAHDYALFLARRSCYSVALPVLRAIEPLFGSGDPMRVLWCATTAEVSAALHQQVLFDRVSAEVLQTVQVTEEHAAIALLRVADGYRRFGLWNEAEALAGRSLEIACGARKVNHKGERTNS